jgi:DNA polymerase III subunit epsilon
MPQPSQIVNDPAEHLRTRLFALTSRGALLRIASALGLVGMDQRHTYAIINAIRENREAEVGQILAQLSDIELKMLANDLSVGGSSRDERMARLLGFAQGQPHAPATVSATPVAPAAPVAPVAASSAVSSPSPVTLTERAPVSVGPASVGGRGPASVGGATRFDEDFSLAPPSSRAPRSKRGPSRLPGSASETFVAIDFETADHGRDSACAVALVRVENDQIVRRVAWLIRPPRPDFLHTHVHGISWQMVVGQPTFGQLWPRLAPVLEGASYLVAHNAPFDRSVLRACCTAASLPEPPLEFECTVQMARRLWAPAQATLPFLCQRFGIPLQHHDAASDAEACARLVLVARSQRR